MKARNEAAVQHYMSTPNRLPNGGGESHTFNVAAINDQEEPACMGGVLLAGIIMGLASFGIFSGLRAVF